MPEQNPRPLLNSPRLLAALAIALPLLLLQMIYRSNTPYFVGGDEYCRADFAFQWAWDPYLATGDHVWLPGQFYILGLLYLILNNMAIGVLLAGTVGSLLTVWLVAELAWRLWRSVPAAAGAALLAGTHPFLMVMAQSPMSEAFFLPLHLAALLLVWLAFFPGSPATAADEAPEAFPHRHRRPLLLLGAAACTGLGTMFRYEAWYTGFLLGLLVSGFCAYSGYRRNWAAAGLYAAAAVVLAAWPLVWMASAYLKFDDPLVFLRKTIEVNEQTNWDNDYSNRLALFFTYPRALYEDHFPHLLLPLAGLILAGVFRRKRVFIFFGIIAVMMIMGMVATSRSGLGSSYRDRMTLFLLLPLVAVGGGPIGAAWEATRRLGAWHWVGQAAVALILLVFAVDRFDAAWDRRTNAWRVHPEVLGLVRVLEAEDDPSRAQVPDYPRILPDGIRMLVYTGGRAEEFWMMRYHSGRAEAFEAVWDRGALPWHVAQQPLPARVLLRNPEELGPLPAELRLLDTMEPYALYSWETPSAAIE